MRNPVLALAAAGLLAATIRISAPCHQERTLAPATPEHARYTALFNQKRAEMPTREALSRLHKRMKPDMFHLHDKLQRMNPATGEVPADGYARAYEYIVETWGDPFRHTEGSGNALLWEERGPGGIGGRTRAILWDPNDSNNKAVFAGGVGGGLWHTPDVTVAAPAWTQVSPVFANIAVTCINYNPGNPQVMYFGTGEGWFNADAIRGAGVWKSTDGGDTWAVLPASQNSVFYYCQDITVTADGTLYVATKSGLQRSSDGGATFVKVLGSGTGSGGDFITDLEIGGDGNLYAAISSSGIFRSLASLGTTQGQAGNWTRLQMNFPAGYDRIELAVGKNNPNYMYAVSDVAQATSDVYRSTNGGTSWAATTGQPNGGNYANDQAWYDLTLEVDPDNHLVVYTGGIDEYRTTNGGTSWTKLTAAYGGSQPYMHPDQHGIAINPANSNQVIFTNDGGVYYSTTQGTNPTHRNNTYRVTQFYSLAIDPRAYSDVLIGGTQDNGSIMVNQPGIGMGIDLTGADGSYCAINHVHPDTMFTTMQYDPVYRSRDGGNSFNYIGNLNLDDTNTMFINPLEIDPNNPSVIYQASTSLWRNGNASGGGSGSWVRVTASLGSAITAIAPAKTVANLVYFAAGGTVYRLPNANTSNSSTQPATVNPSGAGAGYINCILVNPTDANHIIITYSSFGLTRRVMECRNADQGANATWKNLTGNLPDIPCNWAAFEPTNPNGILVGTDMGIFRCTDITLPAASIYYTPENTGLGLPRVSMIKTKYSDNSIHIGTHGRGFFSTWSYNQAPTALFGTSQLNACGGQVQFFDSTFNAPTAWSWNFGDGGTSTSQSPVHTYTSSGTYTVSLTASNPSGSSSSTQTITVTVLPAANASAGPDISACPGDSLQLSATGGVTYAWFPTAGLSDPTIANPIATVSGTRTYTVTVTDANGCSDIDTLVITQLTAPSVWAGQDQTIAVPGDSVQLQGQGGVTYLWTPATGLSCTTCPNPKASPATTTTYTFTGYGANGCGRSDNVNVNVLAVGISDPGTSGTAIRSISPNPARSQARIDYHLAAAGPARITLVDIQGRVLATLLQAEQSAGSHSLQIDTQGIAPGVYFLRMDAAGTTSTQKMQVIR